METRFRLNGNSQMKVEFETEQLKWLEACTSFKWIDYEEFN